MIVEVFTKRFIKCPFCKGHDFAIDHLIGTSSIHAGPWYCGSCGRAFTLIGHPDGRVDVTDAKKRKRTVKVVLEIPPQDSSILLEVEGSEYDEGGGFLGVDEQADRHRFYYEEHTCPTNYLRQIKSISVNGEEDPHGIASFVSASHAEGAAE